MQAPAPRQSSNRAVLALVFGILGFTGCSCLAPFAWWLGAAERADIRRGVIPPDNQGLATAGMVLGIIGTVLMLVGLLALLVWFLLLGGVALSQHGIILL